MKAAVLYGKEQIKIEDIPAPPLKSGEVRVQIEAALTCGTDLKVYKRGYHAKMIVPPAVFGHEMAGVISEIHPAVKDWTPGDRVVVANSAPCRHCFFCLAGQENLCDDLLFLNGAYAESIVVPARIVQNNMLALAPETRFRDAALVEPLACVVQGIEDVRLGKGQRVLVIGSGPIGLMFVALGRNAGCQVVMAGRGESRLRAALRLDADAVVDVSEANDVCEAVRSSVRRPFDVVIEAVGKPETWEAAVKLVRKGGTVNFFGGCPSGTTVNLDTGLLHYSNLHLLASFHHTPQTIRRALRFIEAGVVTGELLVDGECPLSKLPELFQGMAAGNRGIKTLIQVRE